MTTINTLHFEAEAFLNKALIKKVYLVGAALFLASVGCILWAIANWEDYSEVVYSIKYQRNTEIGLAPILYGWGWLFAIAIPVIYGLMWFSFDFSNPVFAVNRDGVFVNRELFKKTFLSWGEFDRLEKQQNGILWLYLKDPAKIVNQQPKWRRPFLKQTYVKDQSPLTIETQGEYAEINTLIQKYYPKKHV